MKQLIINADDLGLSEGINQAIYDCARAGTVLSATALVHGHAFRQGLELLSGVTGMGIGIHLNLTGLWDAPKGTM
ncbi:MAG: ChbG/HpnK family deacetylase, partial [Planctomycetota bacterium]